MQYWLRGNPLPATQKYWYFFSTGLIGQKSFHCVREALGVVMVSQVLIFKFSVNVRVSKRLHHLWDLRYIPTSAYKGKWSKWANASSVEMFVGTIFGYAIIQMINFNMLSFCCTKIVGKLHLNAGIWNFSPWTTGPHKIPPWTITPGTFAPRTITAE